MQITMELEAQTEPDSEPESEIVPSTKKSRVAQIQAKAWTFHREWEFRIPGEEDVRKIAEFKLEEDVRKSMPTALGVTYLVVLLIPSALSLSPCCHSRKRTNVDFYVKSSIYMWAYGVEIIFTPTASK